MMMFTAFNVFLAIFVIVAFVIGYHKGFFRQCGTLLGIVAGAVMSRALGPSVAEWLAGIVGESWSEGAVDVAAYAAVFLAVVLAFALVARMFRGVLKLAHIGIADSVAGGALKAVLWTFWLSLAINLGAYVTPKALPSGEVGQWVTKFAPSVISSQWASNLYEEFKEAANIPEK